MFLKIKSFFFALLRFSKLNPAVAVIPAVIAGTVAASFVTAAMLKHFKSGAPEEYLSSLDSFASWGNQSEAAPSSEPEEPIAVPVIQPVKKQVEYKGKSINVAEVEVAKPDSKEDSENGNYIKEKPEPAAPIPVDLSIGKFTGGNKNYVYGIDVSSHNKSIDWASVKASGVKFAMIRCGYRGYLTGKIVMDACFEYNIENAYKNGIAVGVYFYSTAVNETEAMEEAAYVNELIREKAEKGVKLSYPVAYDFEEFYNTDNRSRAKTLSRAQISKNAAAFLDFIKSSGHTPLFYAGKNPVKDNFEPYLAAKYKFWLANYANATEYEGKFFMWQFTSSGQISGISGRVDMNVCGFENEDNLPRFSVCAKAGAVAYNRPDVLSGIFTVLTKDEIYFYRNTYNSNFKELKIGDKYCYVPTVDLSAPFEPTGLTYKTVNDETVYEYPVADDKYKTGASVPAQTELNVRGIWGEEWAEISYGGKTCYIKAGDLISEDPAEDTDPGEDSSSAGSEDGSSLSDIPETDSSGESVSPDEDSEESAPSGSPDSETP